MSIEFIKFVNILTNSLMRKQWIFNQYCLFIYHLNKIHKFCFPFIWAPDFIYLFIPFGSFDKSIHMKIIDMGIHLVLCKQTLAFDKEIEKSYKCCSITGSDCRLFFDFLSASILWGSPYLLCDILIASLYPSSDGK